MTAVPVVPVPCRCGLTMRLASDRDAMECRCGLWVAFDAWIAAGDRLPIPPEAFQQGEPWKEPSAGLRVSDSFGDIGIGWEVIDVDPARGPAPPDWQRMCADAFECSGLRYVGPVLRTEDFKQPPRAPHRTGRVLLLENGDELKRHAVYALVPLGQEREAVAAIVRFIRDKHGTGKLWAHGDVPIGPLKKRDSGGWRGAEIGGVLHAVLGCYYFHQPIN